MTVKINGMTLEEIEAQMKKFKKMEKENKKDFKANCPMKYIPDPVFFTPREELDLAKKMGKAVDKALGECEEKRKEKTSDERALELEKLSWRLFNLSMELEDVNSETTAFGGYFIWNKGDAAKMESGTGLKYKEEEYYKDFKKNE